MVSIKLDSYSCKLNNLDSLSFFEIFFFLVLGEKRFIGQVVKKPLLTYGLEFFSNVTKYLSGGPYSEIWMSSHEW